MSSASESYDENFSSEINSSYPEIIFKDDDQIGNKNSSNMFIDVAKKINPMNLFNNKKAPFKAVGYGIDETINEENYKLAISQNGKFVVTFDAANLRIKVLENTDHRPFIYNKKKYHSKNKNNCDGSDQIDKTIAYFKIQNDFTIDKFYSNDLMPSPYRKNTQHSSFSTNETITTEKTYHGSSQHGSFSTTDTITMETIQHACFSTNDTITMEKKDMKNDNRIRWSYDISNMHNKNGKNYIFVAISRVELDEDMMGEKHGGNESLKITKIQNDCKTTIVQIKEGDVLSKESGGVTAIDMQSMQPKLKEKQKLKGIKGTGIYCIELIREKNGRGWALKKITCNYYSSVSGICRFIEVPKNQGSIVKRFLLLNFYGMYNYEFDGYFKFTEKFNYPKSIRRELNYWYTKKNCMNRLLSCIYDIYFLVKQHKDNVELFEVYDMVEMKLTTTAKSIGNDKFTRKNSNIFSFSRLQLCYTQGSNSIKLHYMENGLQVASKTFKELEQIYSLEFIDSDEKLLLIGKSSEEEMRFLIWDIYNTGKVESVVLPNIKNLNTHLARTSGNILQVDDEGKVRSVLKRIENELLRQKNKTEKAEYESEKIMKSNMEESVGIKLNGSPDKNHTVWFDKNINPTFTPIVMDKEPWILGDYKRISFCLYQNKSGTETETLQLMIGSSTVQIWHQIQDDSKNEDDLPNKGEPFLEYIWATGIPVNQETEESRLRVEKFEHEGTNSISNDFYLKVYWYEKDLCENVDEEEVEEDEEIHRVEKDKGIMAVRREKVISRKVIVEKINAIRHACKALDHLNKRKKFLLNNYSKMKKFEKIVAYIEHIVWKFIKYNPDQFKLLDVRRNIMKILILGNCNQLIKYILFGENKEHEHHVKEEGRKIFEIRHVPRNKLWPGKKYMKERELDVIDNNINDSDKMIPENDLELAIYHCKGRELKNTIVVAYLLEYYSKNATENIGWMCTVSKALPLLFKYNYDDYAKKLFRKECFADQDHFSAQDSFEIIPRKYLERRNHDIKFRAFKPIFNLRSDKNRWYNGIFKDNDNDITFKNKVYKFFEDLDNDLGKSPIALRVVPLPKFTINNIPKDKVEYNIFKIILNIFWFLFIPRWYKIGRNEKDKLSPFSRVIHYENNDDIFDNPATEAVIDFHWQKTRAFFLFLFFRFLIFSVCFVLVSWAYCVHEDLNIGSRYILFAFIIMFYYLAIYLIATEFIQLCFHGPREYFSNVFSCFDLISVILPTVVMTLMLKNFQISNGFENVEVTDVGLLTGISFSVFFLWIETILYLRLTSNMALYINYFIYIFKTVFPFIFFMLIVIVAFAHTMFILLRDPLNIDDIKINHNSYSGNATNPSTNENLGLKVESDFDPDDNPFSNFFSSIEAAYFWLSSNWVQKDQFDFWPSEVITVIASLFLVIILQNMLIAFMGGVYEEAETKGRQTLLRSRANHIADYEALHHIHFWNVDPEPEYLYYIGQSKNFEDWYEMRKDDQKSIYEGFEQKSTFMKRIFKLENYDKFSIWNYEHIEFKDEIEEIENMKHEMNFIVEKLLGKLQKS